MPPAKAPKKKAQRAAKLIPKELEGFGQRLRKARQTYSLTAKELGKLTGKSQGYISHLENGTRGVGNLSIGFVILAAKATETRLVWLATGVGSMRDKPAPKAVNSRPS